MLLCFCKPSLQLMQQNPEPASELPEAAHFRPKSMVALYVLKVELKSLSGCILRQYSTTWGHQLTPRLAERSTNSIR